MLQMGCTGVRRPRVRGAFKFGYHVSILRLLPHFDPQLVGRLGIWNRQGILPVLTRKLLMVGPPPLLFPRKLNSAACPWNQSRLYNNFARRLRRGPICLRARLGLSFASFLSLAIVGCSWSQLNLDAIQESDTSRDNSRGRRRHERDDHSGYPRFPRAYTQTSERTVFPGDRTGIARYDAARFDSTPYVPRFATSLCY